MRLRNVKNAQEILLASPYYIENPQEYKGRWGEAFHQKVVHLEIGCGKGNYLIQMAKLYPDILFIGMEYQKSVLVRAIEKVQNEKLDNLKFICWSAEEAATIFTKEIDLLYLNFSDPWPKKRHAKRRLTSQSFLEIYDLIFKEDGLIIQKTDNSALFEYSLENLTQYGYQLEKVSLNLAKSEIDNVKTEYEEKFMNLGYPIYYVKARKKIVKKEEKS